MNGRILHSERSESGQWLWRAGNAGAGVYYYSIAADEKRYTGKLIKY